MTTEKLTLQDCFKYPFAKYRYRETKHHYVEYPSLVNLILSNPNYEFQNVIVDSELILRPLSRLTDEEKDILNFIDCQIKVVHSYDVLYRLNWIRVSEKSKDLIDKFREWNIDIDGLQEKGVAVYE